ncbi:MAG: aminoglycoside adenylyltransferase domain-containing protein [Tepidiformaceae bacterium]
MNSQSRDDVPGTVAEILHRLQATLPGNLSAIDLFGSAAVGAFEDEVSDLDFCIVTSAALSDPEFEALSEMHVALTRDLPTWKDRIEAIYVASDDLRSFRSRAPRLAVVSPGEPFHWRAPEPGRLMNWYDVQKNGMALFGPPPATLFEPITESEFVASARSDLAQWPQWFKELPLRTGAQSYVVLTICRALHACMFATQLSKRDAGLWAMRVFPEWSPLIEKALEWRQTGSGRMQADANEGTVDQIREFVSFASRLGSLAIPDSRA